jgi:stage V sporulation protein G
MQLSEIRINLCGPLPPPAATQASHQLLSAHLSPPNAAPTHPRLAQAASVSRAAGPTPAGNVNGDNARAGRLRAFCSLTFDNTFVVRDVKLIEGNDGLFLAMPSRKLCDRCRRCGEKNHLRARFCNQCGSRLDESRHLPRSASNGNARFQPRPKLHADIAHPINAACRLELERRVLMAYLEELERSKQPGYVAPNLDGDYGDYDEPDHLDAPPAPQTVHLRPTGTSPV